MPLAPDAVSFRTATTNAYPPALPDARYGRVQSSAPDRQGQIEFTGVRLRHHAVEAEAAAASPKNAEHSPERRGILMQAPELPTAITGPKEGMLMPAATDMHPFPADFEIKSIATNGTTLSVTTLSVRIGGQGPAVVLLHGYGETGDMWTALATELARDHTVVAPDLRGMGLSARRAAAYDKKTQGQDIAGLLDALGIERADLVTHDIGKGNWAVGGNTQEPAIVAFPLWRPRYGAPGCRT